MFLDRTNPHQTGETTPTTTNRPIPNDGFRTYWTRPVAEILNGIKEHLELWNGKAKKLKLATVITLLSPSVALRMLHDDEKRLAQWINFFTLSLQIATLKELAGRQTAAGADPKLALDASWIQRNDDVSSFWLESFGEVVSFSD